MTLSRLSIFLLVGTLACLVAAQSSSQPPAGVTATQSLRTQWTNGADTYYLYDITLTNAGASSLPACGLLYLIDFNADVADIDITQTWNLISYATAGSPLHAEFGPTPTTSVAAGQADRSTGYVVKNSLTTLTLLYDGQACSSSSSAASGSASSDSSSSSSSAPSTGCNTMSISQAMASSWGTGSQWGVTITNRGSVAVSVLDLLIVEDTRITQIWGVTSSGSGHYTFPEYTTSIAVGATFSFGYISADVSLVSITINGCSSSAPSSSSSAASSSQEEESGSASASASSSSDSSACSASVDSLGSFEDLNKWSDGTYNYIQYPLTVKNLGTSTIASATAFIYFSSGFGTISDDYNLTVDSVEEGGATVTINTFDLAPGQTFNGAGYTFKYLIANLDDSDYSHSHYTYPYAIRFESAQC